MQSSQQQVKTADLWLLAGTVGPVPGDTTLAAKEPIDNPQPDPRNSLHCEDHVPGLSTALGVFKMRRSDAKIRIFPGEQPGKAVGYFNTSHSLP